MPAETGFSLIAPRLTGVDVLEARTNRINTLLFARRVCWLAQWF
jgi:hypothetical protein